MTGAWIGLAGPAEAALARSAPIASRIPGPVRSWPVTTTWAGDGVCGNACWIRSMVCRTGELAGRSMAGEPSRMPSAGAASASSAIPAAEPHITGRRTTRRTSAAHTRDGRAAVRLRPRNGTRPRSARGPSQASSAGSTVSEPSTATPTTAIVPNAMPLNTSYPVRNSPARAIMTVSPDTTMARPEVAAAVRRAWPGAAPLARSSRSRRR